MIARLCKKPEQFLEALAMLVVGDIAIYHADALLKLRELPSQSVDLVLCDPPYGTTKCKWDVVIPLEEMWSELLRVLTTGGAILLFGTEPFSSRLRLSNINMFKYDIVWDKVRAVGAHVSKYRPMARHELISVFSRGKTTYNPQLVLRESPRIGGKEYGRTQIIGGSVNEEYNKNAASKVYTHKNPTTIQTFSNASNKGRIHPTQKPLPLLEYLIKTYSNEGETVLDFASGSGATLIACQNTKRSGIGIELDDGYFEKSKEWLLRNAKSRSLSGETS